MVGRQQQHMPKQGQGQGRHDWIVDDRILGCGPLRPRGVAAVWKVNSKIKTTSRRPRPNAVLAKKSEGEEPASVQLLDGSDEGVAAAATVVAAAQASIAVQQVVKPRGSESLLRTTLRYALKGAP
jgi:hypothetical protein